MRWLTFAGVLFLSRCGEAAVLKCFPETQDPLCASEKRDISPPPSRPDAECLAGSEWESNCHTCRCSDSGIAQCLKQDSCELQVFEEPIKCKPFTSFPRDCNTCTCLENGLGLCTLIGCGNPIETSRRRRDTPAQQNECTPGSRWKESCNSCWCTDKGVSVCTRVECEGIISKREAPALDSQKKCHPGTSWKKSCNSCWCTDNGIAVCTAKGCPEGQREKRDTSKTGADHIERHSVCKPRGTFYIGCNTCHCNQYGSDYSCTNKPCPLPEDVEIFHELKAVSTTNSSNNTKQVVCVANRMFIMNCNTCWCNEDGTSFFCTRRICIPESTEENKTEDPELEVKLRVIKKECRPDEVFELDCNVCRCSADGKSFSCTRRACVDVDDKNAEFTRKTRAVQEAPKACQPGTEFRMDCNKCLCNDEGQDFSCTRIDCAAQNGNGGGDSFTGTRTKRELSEKMSMQCTAGSVFDRDCNVCRCTADGMHAVCTLKRCKHETTEPEPKSISSFRCTPGDQLKQDCNDCTCSADGKSLFCTIRLCDQMLADINVGQLL